MQYLHKDWMSPASHSNSSPSQQATTQATPRPSPTPSTPPSNHHSTCQDLWRMLLQHLLEIPARMAGGMLCHRFRGTHHHDLAALIAPIRTEINDPVGTADHIKVVLDHQDGIALIHQALHHIHQSVKPLQIQGSAKVWGPDLSRKPENKPLIWTYRSFVFS